MPSVSVVTQNGPVTAEESRSSIKEDLAILDAINRSVDHMRSYIGPDPYVLTIPQDVEPRYHHSYQYQAMQWLHNTPFRYNEGEWMQYQTFFYHEHGKDMYVLHNSLPREQLEDTRSRPATGANTPNAGPKKKISLDAYKKKQTVGTPASEDKQEKQRDAPSSKQYAVKGPVEMIKAETEEVLAAVAEAEETPFEVDKMEVKPNREDKKDRRDPQIKAIGEQAKDQGSAKDAQAASPALSLKQLDANASQTVGSTTPKEAEMTPEIAAESAMPPKLSPLAVVSLPSRLSPTIPVNIADTLKARAHFRSTSPDRSAPNSASKSGKLTPIKEVAKVVKRKSPVPRNGFRANSSSPALRSDADDRERPATSVPQQVGTPELSQDDEIAVGKALKTIKQRQPSIIVKLNYKKQHRDDIRRILNMRPQPGKTATPQSPVSEQMEDVKIERPVTRTARDRRDTNAKGVAQKVGPVKNGVDKKLEDKPTSTEKRPPLDQEEQAERPAKKQKTASETVDTKEDPRTPVQSDLHSPNVQSNTLKSQQATPSVRKDHLSVAMQRELSSDSHKMGTPSAQSGTPIAVGQNLQANGAQRPPSSQPSNKTPLQQAWETEQRRLETIGRELKHAATAHLKSLHVVQPDAPGPLSEQKLAAIKSMESLLAYLLAFTSADEAALAADPRQNPSTKPWRTLQGFFSFVKRNCEPFPLLVGLSCWLGVVFNAHILDITAKHPAEGPSRDTIIDTNGMLQRAAIDGEAKLDMDVLQEAFPRTWKRRAKTIQTVESLAPCEFGGQYKLPIGVQTVPLQAARAGFAMLEEWIQKEGIDYQLRLRL